MNYSIYILGFLFIFIIRCSDNGVKPPVDDELCDITDTTSHNFSFVLDTLGKFPSALFDVVATNPSNVWGVGYIELKDYPESDMYNAFRWDGNNYEFFRVYQGPGAPRLDVLLAFSDNELWFFGQDRYAFWDGDTFSYGYIPIGGAKGSINDAWGLGSDDFYLVGNNGSITYSNGTEFYLMESGTNRDLSHIAGYFDNETGLTKMWALGDYIILYYNGISWNILWQDINPYIEGLNSPSGIFIPKPGYVMLGLWKSSRTYGYCFKESDLNINKYLFDTDVSALDIAGESLSDLFLAGSGNEVAHFNGNTIREYKEISGHDYNRSVSYLNNNVFIVGTMDIQQGLFIRGTRN